VGLVDHDRGAEEPDRGTTVHDRAVDAALASIRLDGTLFFRSEFTESWAYLSPPPDMVAALLRPGAERLIMFHIVSTGRCWVSADGGEPHWAVAGDVIVLPYGDQHAVGGTEPADIVPITTMMEPPPWASLPTLRHGAGGARTDIVCGYLHSIDPLFDPALKALPPVFVVHPPEGPAAQFVEASIDYALSTATGYAADAPSDTRLAELLLIEVLRLYLASVPTARHGWFAALRDPVLAPAMSLIHADPDRRWTVASLAAGVSVSRSQLDQRFRAVLGLSPMRYVTQWRMHVARGLLVETDLPVSAIAHRAGYESEEAFSRAFKREHDASPGAWRQANGIGA
jgi:AraC-like DNA-binding protein